ncbi:hypothetical protein BC936DRAFT_146692 [Jimgerdemannia flammicorona]|uniref:RRM domain-containing protein n=1 Tax=Jimgerdemannia flammicorona TaxID=994334 RepID=A0A433D6Z0_9FUNG|nr:hypothetical protein BC936DRAFT_146692 [Jimgerdemannia flammicorona]
MSTTVSGMVKNIFYKSFPFLRASSRDDEGTHKVALVHFERESAAKTAILLTNALIDDSHITVEPYFKDVASSSSAEECTEPANGQEHKIKTNIIVEILASGYKIQDQIIAKGLEYDAKYGVSSIVQGYLTRIQNNGMPYVKAVDEKYHVYDTVTAKATEIDAKYDIQGKALNAAQTAQTHAKTALSTPTGQRVQEFATQTLAQIAAVHAEAKRIAVSVLFFGFGFVPSSSGVLDGVKRFRK